ncbi:hypothetical protein BJ322DRAFT_339688 [Thelephora terrestris]|uniref:N-acetyltransferase domain-containing protein n=1 Tax=Thelephora terrestris TaxID=56493 RepID=A0A9P6L2I9_9AGAM|nr:hypothetical protein BJ322DRAFT_339688 [Thelephora terrestris]
MSAYGAIGPKRHRGESPLPNTRWTVRDKTTGSPIFIDMHHLTLEMAMKCPGLVEYLHSVFARVVEDGRTYPMEVAEGESYSRQAFEGYFFAADVIVGVLAAEGNGDGFSVDQQAAAQVIPGTDRPLGLSGSSQDGKPLVWGNVVAGFYYVKPNYPGRSSHICNAGFIVPPNHWNKGYGRVLANSFLYYGPKLGYQASVFNLVYVNNIASVKLWEALGFTRAGLIPNAGRLKKEGGGEEYVDAIIYYKDFEDCKQ